MGRTARDNRPNIKPVERIELSESALTLRLVLFVVIGLIGIGAFIYGFSALFSVDPGWRTISVASSELNVSSDFVLQYELGRGELSATAEYRELSNTYTELCEKAAMLFDIDNDYDEEVSLHYISSHPNETIEVDPCIYEMFEIMAEYDDRTIFMAPVYDLYDDIFFSSDDENAKSLDAHFSDEMANEIGEYLSFINDDEMISISLLGFNKLRLDVSNEYLAFAKENEIRSFLNPIYYRNAFILDFLADNLIAKGFDYGIITSTNGYSRILSRLDVPNGYVFYQRSGHDIYQALTIYLQDKSSVVFLHDFPLADSDKYLYYSYADGSAATPYLGEEGIYENAYSSLLSYGNKKAGELVIASGKAYAKRNCDLHDLLSLRDNGIYSLASGEDNTVYYSDKSLCFNNLYEDEKITFKLELLGK
ncbi:MAG: hypothetical protein PUD22_09335 [Erysipelotrichaceae bacterium]|nr:hypothetical protein [Erysipelotrichaceae bacterium]